MNERKRKAERKKVQTRNDISWKVEKRAAHSERKKKMLKGNLK